MLQAIQSIFTESEGTSTDPFIRSESATVYNVYRSPSETEWIWIRKSDNQLVYMQQYRPELKRLVVHFFGSINKDGVVESPGFSGRNEKPFFWEFKLFKCNK